MTILVTGGAGFIGANFIHYFLRNTQNETIINVDKLSYAGNLQNLAEIESDKRYHFYHVDIANQKTIERILCKHRPKAIIHFAAESHVDNSIQQPFELVKNNIIGTLSLLNSSYQYYSGLEKNERAEFRFINISTDEVFGSLSAEEAAFTENTPYAPNNPYSASKAGADHLARAWFSTYQLPVITSNCSNNYGPMQYPEKLIPVVIQSALTGKKIPVYGDGMNIRDWLYVEDHCTAIKTLIKSGKPGETYNIGGHCELTNIDVVKIICKTLDELKPLKDNQSYSELIEYVKDRRGHDRRYSTNTEKIHGQLGWSPKEIFDSGIRKTVQWYLNNPSWMNNILNKTNYQSTNIKNLNKVKEKISYA